MHDITSILLSTAVGLLAIACGPSIYELPPPPPDEARQDVELDPIARGAADADAYIAARQSTLALYQALATASWDEAWDQLSSETRVLLDGGSEGQGERALSDGRITLDGVTWAFDPVDVFVVRDMTGFDDESPGAAEHETTRRKEIWVSNADAEVRRVVVIREGDQWLVHLPRIPSERLQRAEQ